MTFVRSRFSALFASILIAAATSCGGGGGGDSGPAGPLSGSEMWGRAASGEGRGLGYGIAQSSIGEVAITGGFDQTADFGNGTLTSKGGDDLYVARYDAAGKPLWSRSFGDGETQLGIAVALDSAGNTLVGGNNSGVIDFGGGALTAVAGEEDVFIAKLDASGTHQWSRQFGDGKLQSLADLAVDASGNVLATGTNAGTVDFGNGPLTAGATLHGWIAKLDGAGKATWSLDLGGDGAVHALGIAADPSSNVYLVGSFQGTLNLGGGPLAAVADDDIFIAKLDGAGHHLWSKRFGGSGAETATSVSVDAAGNAYVVGVLGGGTDFGGGVIGGAASLYVVRFDTNGNHVWSKSFDGGSDRQARSIAADADGNVCLTGVFSGSLDLGGGPLISATSDPSAPDVFVARLDSTGKHLWSKSGHSTGVGGFGVAVDGQGNPAILGGFFGTVDFGTPLTGGPAVRPFLVKLVR